MPTPSHDIHEKKNQISAKMFVKTKNDLLISHCHLMDIRDHGRATTT
ncbi:unknown [Prevotella sp. CAG:873]|nr:unknown [Prevotella sp. CAG:873]